MVLADRLKKSIQEVLQMTTLEIELWAGFMLYEDEERKRQTSKQKTMPQQATRRRK
tara:strand:- start:3467 stop:3634 length:168 start_codon:yes stop_codon:yes gene_type:complete